MWRLEKTRKDLEENILRRWQAEWDVSEKGRNVYKWCGKVGRDLIPLSHKAAQFITGHGNFGSYLYRFKLGGRLSGECECGAGEEDVEYIRRVCKSQDRSRGRNIFGTLKKMTLLRQPFLRC